MRIHPLAAVMFAAVCGFGQAPGTLVTGAGNGSLGNSGDGGLATKASVGNPNGIAVDPVGNLYILDKVFNIVRKADTKGIISTLWIFADSNWNTGDTNQSAREYRGV